MATVKQMAFESFSERMGNSLEALQKHGFAFFLGYSDCAKGFLEAMKTLIDEGYSIEAIKYYVEKKLSEFDDPDECVNINMNDGKIDCKQLG